MMRHMAQNRVTDMTKTITAQLIAGLLALLAVAVLGLALHATAPQMGADATYPVQPPLLQADGTPDHTSADWR